jgi:ABC-type nitrate/sulfonate/bicarbonate transport system permease component
MRKRFNVPGLVLPIVLIGLWQLIVKAGILKLDYVPAPTEILTAFFDLIETGELWPDLEHTLIAVTVAWLIAVIGGVALGVIVGLFASAWNWSMASISVLRTLPAVAVVPVTLLIFGYSMTAEIVVAAVVAIWPVVLSAGVAVQSAGPRLRDVARTYRLSRIDTVRKMILPAAFPVTVVAARLALSVCLILVILTEMIGNPKGLGYGLIRMQQGLNPEGMWAYLIFIGNLGLLMQVTLTWAARKAMPGFAPQLGTRSS